MGFWREQDPIIENGRVVKGGMWHHQRMWWYSQNYIKALVGGYGSGKSLICAKRAIAVTLQNALTNGAIVPTMIVSPSYKIGKRTVIPAILELLEGRRMKYRYLKSDSELTIRHKDVQNLIWFGSGEDADALKGPNLGAAYIDEPFIQERAVFDQMVARVRHPMARHREIGLLGCITRDSLVLPTTGLCEIEAFDNKTPPKSSNKIDAWLYGLDRTTHKAECFYNNGYAPTIKVKAQNGYRLEGTHNHRIWVMGANGTPQWKRLDLLSKGDHIAIARGMEIWGNKDPLDGFRFETNRRVKHGLDLPGGMTKHFAYFLGLWIAEGSIDGDRISITCGDDDPLDWLEEGGLFALRFSRNRDDQVRINCKRLAELMRYLEMPLCKSPGRYIPAWVLAAPREIALAFMAGMYDGDGHVCANGDGIGYSTTSEKLARQIHMMLLNVGVVASLIRTKIPPTDRVSVSSIVWRVVALGNRAALLAKELPMRVKRKRRHFKAYQPVSCSDDVPNQSDFILRAWECRKHIRWRKGKSNLEPNQIVASARRSESVSYGTIKDFLARWDANESFEPRSIAALRKTVEDGYYWAEVVDLQASAAETVDFVVPDTHSYFSNGFISHNTPEQLNFGYDILVGEEKDNWDTDLIVAKTSDNKALDPQYVQTLIAGYTDKMKRAYVDGEFINLATGLIYYGFDRRKHITKLVDPGGPLFAGMDFNVNPMAATIFWRRGSMMHFVDEIELPQSDTAEMCDEIHRRFPQRVKVVYPDPTGTRSQSSGSGAKGSKSDHAIIRGKGFHVLARPSGQPLRRDRINATNVAFNKQILTLDPKCKKLAKYFEQLSYEMFSKQQEMTHLTDAATYPVEYQFPVIDAHESREHRLV